MSNETKQKAVEWYANRLCDIEIAYNQGVIDTEVYVKSKTHAYEQAKEMQKKQMVDFALKCMFAHVVPSQATREVIEKLFDEYYKEQFGGS
jgi:hypothetical protein